MIRGWLYFPFTITIIIIVWPMVIRHHIKLDRCNHSFIQCLPNHPPTQSLLLSDRQYRIDGPQIKLIPTTTWYNNNNNNKSSGRVSYLPSTLLFCLIITAGQDHRHRRTTRGWTNVRDEAFKQQWMILAIIFTLKSVSINYSYSSWLPFCASPNPHALITSRVEARGQQLVYSQPSVALAMEISQCSVYGETI